MADRINFDKEINDSVQVGDELYHSAITSEVGRVVTTNWIIAFSDTTQGTNVFTLSGIGTENIPIVRIGDQVVEIETTNGTLFSAPFSTDRYVTDIDYSTGEVTLDGTMYNGLGIAGIGSTVKFETYVQAVGSETSLGTITAIGEKYVEVADAGSAAVDDFFMFRKPVEQNVSSLKGYFAEVEFSNDSTEKQELFAVGSEITISSK